VTFFPKRGEPAGPALAVCRGCEVRSKCATYAASLDGPVVRVWVGRPAWDAGGLGGRNGSRVVHRPNQLSAWLAKAAGGP
jgi:hypothetical protein